MFNFSPSVTTIFNIAGQSVKSPVEDSSVMENTKKAIGPIKPAMLPRKPTHKIIATSPNRNASDLQQDELVFHFNLG